MKKVCWIGAGIMGLPMIERLRAAGYTVETWRRSDACSSEQGRRLGDLVRDSSVVVTMLGTPQDVEDLYFRPDGILDHLSAGSLMIDMTTSSPELARRISDAATGKSSASVDAPVSGGPPAAASGTLSIMAGGTVRAFDSAHELFDVLGQTIVHHGGPGSGQTAKLMNQVMIAAITQATTELFPMVRKAGMKSELVLRSMTSGAASSPLLTFLWNKLEAEDSSPGFQVTHLLKDLDLGLGLAHELQMPLPLTELVRQITAETERAWGGTVGTQMLGAPSTRQETS